jgi:chitodextrinase
MAEDITITKVGSVPKKVIIPVVVAAAAFVGWRYWQARQTAASTDSTVTNGDFGAVDSSIPGVVGAVSSDNSYGGDTGNTSTTSTGKTTDAEWTNDVVLAFASAGSTTSGDDVLQALGLYLNNQPMTDAQKSIVQRAIAVAGYPYGTGAHTIVAGGNTALTIAPSGLKVTGVTSTTVTLSWSPVAGATGYRAYRSGVATNVGSSVGTSVTVGGLTPNTSYSFHVAAVTASGSLSPSSSSVTGKTSAVTLSKPATPSVSGITKTEATLKVSAVANATGYNWYINGVAHGHSDGTQYTVSGLRAGTKYTAAVSADTSTQAGGPRSATRSFTTKK